MSMLGRRSGVRGGPPPSRRRRPDAGRRGTSQRCRMAPRTPAVARCRCGESAWHSRTCHPPRHGQRELRVTGSRRGGEAAGGGIPASQVDRRAPGLRPSVVEVARRAGLRNRERGVSTEKCRSALRATRRPARCWATLLSMGCGSSSSAAESVSAAARQEAIGIPHGVVREQRRGPVTDGTCAVSDGWGCSAGTRALGGRSQYASMRRRPVAA